MSTFSKTFGSCLVQQGSVLNQWTVLNLLTDGAFSRNSIASMYNPSLDTMSDFTADQRRTLDVPIANASELIIRTNEGGGSSSLKICANNGTYIFATDGVANKIYRSTDGNTWNEVVPNIAIGTDEFKGHGVIHVLQNGRLLRIVPGSGQYIPYYSDDHGLTWIASVNTVGGASYNVKGSVATWGIGINEINGTICMSSYGGQTSSTIQRSTDNGASWTLVGDINILGLTLCGLQSNIVSIASSTKTIVLSGNVASRHTSGVKIYLSGTTGGSNDGVKTVVSSSYSSPNTSVIVSESCVDQAGTGGISGRNVDHFHAIGYHAGTSKWLLNTGDGGDNALNIISTDDGLTWSRFGTSTGFSTFHQYTKLIDTGDATRILCGSDGVAKIHWLDLTTGEGDPLIWNWNTISSASKQYCWQIFKYDGIYYGCSFDSSNSGSREAVVSISSDLINWRTYARINDNTINGLFHFGGFVNGYLHLSAPTDVNLSNTWKHVLLKPSKISTITGILVEPACTNLVTNANMSDAESATGWADAGSYGVISLDTSVKLHGSKSIKSYDATPGKGRFIQARFTSQARTAGVVYGGRVFIRGGVSGIYGGASANGCYIQNGSQSEPYSRFEMSKNRWTPVILNPFTSPDTSIANITATGYEHDNLSGVFSGLMNLDCVQYQTLPLTSWQIAGTQRVIEKLSIPLVLPSSWTLYFISIPQFHSVHAGSNNLYLCSLKVSASIFIEVYWDVAVSKWTLRLKTDSVDQTAVSEATGFIWEQQLSFAIRCVNGTIKLSVNDGDGWNHLTGIDGFSGANLDFLSGNNSGDSVFPQLIADLKYKKYAILDSEL